MRVTITSTGPVTVTIDTDDLEAEEDYEGPDDMVAGPLSADLTHTEQRDPLSHTEEYGTDDHARRGRRVGGIAPTHRPPFGIRA